MQAVRGPVALGACAKCQGGSMGRGAREVEEQLRVVGCSWRRTNKQLGASVFREGARNDAESRSYLGNSEFFRWRGCESDVVGGGGAAAGRLESLDSLCTCLCPNPERCVITTVMSRVTPVSHFRNGVTCTCTVTVTVTLLWQGTVTTTITAVSFLTVTVTRAPSTLTVWCLF
jgi:hypothetical protein